jgi:DNA-binding response OmpR family regulator
MHADVDPTMLLEASARRPRRVLVVDDDPHIRRILTLNFEDEGYEVSVAADGDEATEMARTLHPDVMVLDVMMPRSDGFTVLRMLRSSPQTDDIPILLLSAKASDDEVFAGWRSGADSYVTKPFEVDDVLRIVAELSAQAEPQDGERGPGELPAEGAGHDRRLQERRADERRQE